MNLRTFKTRNIMLHFSVAAETLVKVQLYEYSKAQETRVYLLPFSSCSSILPTPIYKP